MCEWNTLFGGSFITNLLHIPFKNDDDDVLVNVNITKSSNPFFFLIFSYNFAVTKYTSCSHKQNNCNTSMLWKHQHNWCVLLFLKMLVTISWLTRRPLYFIVYQTFYHFTHAPLFIEKSYFALMCWIFKQGREKQITTNITKWKRDCDKPLQIFSSKRNFARAREFSCACNHSNAPVTDVWICWGKKVLIKRDQ